MGEQQSNHTMTLEQRKSLTMTGVNEVVSFDDTAVVLRTCMGDLTVLGRELRLKTLSTEGGRVAVTGQISALTYDEPREPGGWLRRMFR